MSRRWTVSTRDSAGLVSRYAEPFSFILGGVEPPTSISATGASLTSGTAAIRRTTGISATGASLTSGTAAIRRTTAISASGLSLTSGSAAAALVPSAPAPAPTNLAAQNIAGAIRLTWQGSSPSYRLERERWTGTGDPTEGEELPTTYDMYVSSAGLDANAGTYSSPKRTIQAALNALPTSGERTVGIFNGTYREATTVSRTGITHLQGQSEDGVIISGAEQYSSWTNHSGNIWRAAWAYTWGAEPNPWPGESDPPEGVRRREIVVIDGVVMRQWVTYADMAANPNSFFVSEAESRLYINRAGWTAGSVAEVGIRQLGIRLLGPATVKKLTVQHVASRFFVVSEAGIQVEGYHTQLLEKVTVRQCGQDGIKLREGSNTTLRDVTSFENGYQGIQSFRQQDNFYERVNCTHNALRGWWWDYLGWDVGNKHVRNRRLHIKDSKFSNNYARGLWLDIDVNDVLIEDTEINDNNRHGIYLEYSPGPFVLRRVHIRRNGVTGGDRREGLQINCDNVLLEDCIIRDNTGRAIMVTGTNDRVHSVWAPCTQTYWPGPALTLPAQGTNYNPRNLNLGWTGCTITVPNTFSTNDWCIVINYTRDGGPLGNEEEIIANLGPLASNTYFAVAGTSRVSLSNAGARNLGQWQTYTGKEQGSTYADPGP
jgi:hypothetical protein